MKYKRIDIVKLRKKGLTYRQIQKELGISSLSIIKHHLDMSRLEFKTMSNLKKENLKLKKENAILNTKINKLWVVLKDKNIIHT